FTAIFTQTVTGFGLALVSMPLLILILPIQVASPLVALVGGLAETLLLLKYREAFNFRAVSVLIAASLIGIPVGVYLLGWVDAGVVTAVLGLIVIAYALYALIGFNPPQLVSRGWAVLFGFIGGILGGAYNTSGPPIIIYGSCRRWPPAEFKSNLQGFFLVTSITVIFTHFLSGNFTPVVWYNFFIAIPAILLALFIGFRLDKYIDPLRFRKIVLVTLLVLGTGLIVL
ncbi:MAG: sulfite exporter TauE/SafE family protein, partial [Anaerolineae bacterium]|nr:sulfite exporter TauE/SafE family protein [Anaerolineae bacterium]